MVPIPERHQHPFLVLLRRHRRRHRGRHPLLRTLALLGGGLCLVIGAGMLVLPGPGLLVTAIGLGALALEFDWAERWLAVALDRSSKLRALFARSRLLLTLFAVADTLVLAGVLVAIFVLHWNLLRF